MDFECLEVRTALMDCQNLYHYKTLFSVFGDSSSTVHVYFGFRKYASIAKIWHLSFCAVWEICHIFFP
jgi:hypothetical protein